MKISALLYLIVILSFLMPFFVVSCQQTELITVKGITLVTGGEAKLAMGDMLEGLNLDQAKKPEDQKIKAQPLAIAALALAVLAIILVLLLPRNLYIIPALISVAGIICLQLLKGGMMDAMAMNSSGLDPSIDLSKVLSIKAKFGFWLANISFFLGAGVAVAGSLLGKQTESYHYKPAHASGAYEHLRPVPPLEPLKPQTTESEPQSATEPEDTAKEQDTEI